MSTETLELTLEISDIQQLGDKPKWMNADWLVTVGTLLEVGSFVGANGREITWSAPVVEAIIKTAANKPIHIFHPNKPDQRKEDVGRIYGVFFEDGVGKIKYVTWDKEANEGISSGEFKLSLEANVTGAFKQENKYDAVSGMINAAALIHTPAVPNAINESIAAVALERQQEIKVEASADANPGIKFPNSAQLDKDDLSPCVSLLQKNGFKVTKGTVTNMSTEKTGADAPENTTVEQEKPEVVPVVPPTETTVSTAPEVVPEVVPEVIESVVSREEYSAMKTQMEKMNVALGVQAEAMAKLEGTDLKTIKDKILNVAPKTDFNVLLEGARDEDEKKRILNARLSGLTSRDSPEVHLEGVDSANTGEKPDPKEVEEHYFKEYLGFEQNPLKVKESDK